jgi:molybdate transport system regulatory protein
MISRNPHVLAKSLCHIVYYGVSMGKNFFHKQETIRPSLRGHIWLEGSEGTFLGYGRIALLERIREYGSITKAAKALEMPYRKAWLLIDSMNRQVPKPFVVTSSGGKKGGGTRVTPEGEKAIEIFWKIHNKFQKFLKNQADAVKSIYE